MVGFRVFDVGLLIVWLVWFFRLRDDGSDSPPEDDEGGGGGGPERTPGRGLGRRLASNCPAVPCPKAATERGTVTGRRAPAVAVRAGRCPARSPLGRECDSPGGAPGA